MARDERPPEGRLIERAREERDLSQNEAARRAGMSGTRWRQIVDGAASGMTSKRGIRTLARMAEVVGGDAAAFRGIGRDDVADALEVQTAGEEYADDFKDDPEFQELIDQLPPRARRRALEEWADARERAREDYKRTLRLAAEAANDDSSDRRAR